MTNIDWPVVSHTEAFCLWASGYAGEILTAVSHAMKALETEVGCRLLDRVGKRALLTQAGEQFLRHTEKFYARWKQRVPVWIR
jgi:hypothetical protein